MLLLATMIAVQAATAEQSCQSAAPRVGSDPVAAFPAAVDGTRLKSLRDVARLRARGGANLIVVRGGDFSGNKAARLNLDNVCFLDSKLQRTDWRRARASGIGFIRSDLSGSNLSGAQLPGILLRESNLSGVDASAAILDGGRIDGGWAGSLSQLNLDRARLARFQLVCGSREEDGCPFDRSGMSIRGTDFSGANLATFSFWDTALDGAILDNTHVGMQQIGQLDRLVVRGPIILHSPRRHVTLQPDEYLAVRRGIRPLHKAAAAPQEQARPDPAACARIGDRRRRALCQGGAELQSLREQAEAGATTPAELQRLAQRESFCTNLSDDLVARCLERFYRSVAAPRAAAPSSAEAGQRIGDVTLLASLPVAFADEFRSSPLYTRILPLFVDSAPAQLVARPGAGGLVSLSGASQAGCRVEATGLRFNPATGWYATAQRGTSRRRGRAAPSRLAPVVRFTAAGAEFADATTAVTCPDGASLDPLVRVDAPADLVDLLTETPDT